LLLGALAAALPPRDFELGTDVFELHRLRSSLVGIEDSRHDRGQGLVRAGRPVGVEFVGYFELGELGGVAAVEELPDEQSVMGGDSVPQEPLLSCGEQPFFISSRSTRRTAFSFAAAL
jgi:hypothetical protein